MKNIRGWLAWLVLICASSLPAFAHAHLLSSIPRVGSVIHGPAVVIALKFNSRVDSARSSLELILPDGKIESLRISASGDAELDAHAGVTPGKYAIRWQALSIDGHMTRGEIPFTVR